MKLEVGQFIRTNDGYINKIEKVNQFNVLVDGRDLFGEKLNIPNNEITKASYNIIDILEEGDYVNGYYVSKIWEKDEITHYVNETPIKRKEREIVIQAPSYGGIEILKNKNIKSVITHEQMEQMAYKVGE